MTGQHVGALSDSLADDPTLDAVRAAARQSMAALKPQARKRPGFDTGDGDVCPVDPSHRKMHVLSKAAQWCANQTHDGHGFGINRVEGSRNIWPIQFFERAVAEWRSGTVERVDLPGLTIDIGE